MGRTRMRALGVGGLRIAVEAPPALPWHWPAGPLQRFASPAEDADLVLGVRVGRIEAPRGESVRYDSGGGIFDVGQVGCDWIVTLRIRGRVQRMARLDADFRMGEVVVAPDSFYALECHYPLAYPLDEVLFMHRLARLGGLLVHACGAERDGRVMLFTGPSGAGKTTMARLMQRHAGVRVLSDDRIVLRPDADGAIRAWGTPWHGEAPLSCATSARLAGIHAIRHAPRLDPRPLAGVHAAAAVLGNAFAPLHDPVAAERVLAFAERLVASVPVTDLGFARDRRAVDHVWGAAQDASRAA